MKNEECRMKNNAIRMEVKYILYSTFFILHSTFFIHLACCELALFIPSKDDSMKFGPMTSGIA